MSSFEEDNPYVPGPLHDMYEDQKRSYNGMKGAAKQGDMDAYHRHEEAYHRKGNPEKYGTTGEVIFR